MSTERAVDIPDLHSAEEFTRFYRLNLPAVYGYLFRLCGSDRAAAEDLTQDTWMALAKEVRRGNSECADVRWLLTVARSRFLDHARREQRYQRKLALVRSSTTTELVDPPQKDDVLVGLDSLQPIHRLVLMLRYVEDMSVPTVASTIDRNITATNSLLARARLELRQSLGRSQ